MEEIRDVEHKERKMPPIVKIPEAWSAIADGRVKGVGDNRFEVDSSNGEKSYIVTLSGTRYRSNDSATKFVRYPGYPVLAVMMENGQLPLNKNLLVYFKDINWNAINQKYKRDYSAALQAALDEKNISAEERKHIYDEMQYCYDKLRESEYHV